MTLLRRFSAALFGALFLQLTLLGSGTLRAESASAARGVQVSAHQAMGTGAHGMSSTARAAASESTPANGPDMPMGCDMSGSGADCHQPLSPGLCLSAATCTAAVIPAVVASLPSPAAPDPAELPEPAYVRSGPSSAPELPPPRA